MEILNIGVIRKENLNKHSFEKLAGVLPDTIYIVYIIQYQKLAEQIKKALIEKGKKISGFKQVLGCSELKKQNSILLIGSGRFHAFNLARYCNQLYIFDNHTVSKIGKNEIMKLKLRERARYAKFLASSNIGILVSKKPGQYNMKKALEIKKKIEAQGKKAVIFLGGDINITELENFPIDFWVNTACPGLALDTNKIIDYKLIK